MENESQFQRHDEAVATFAANIVKGNAAGIAASLAAGFQGMSVGFPLGCFLIGALGYGLYQLGEIVGTHEVFSYYIRFGKAELRSLGRKWADTIKDPSEANAPKWEDRSVMLQTIGGVLAITGFLLGVISGFLIVAFR
jgi:hypothetical protein